MIGALLLCFGLALSSSTQAAPILIDEILLPAKTRELVRGDLRQIEQLQFRGASPAFDYFFGGPTGRSLLRFIENRVRYVGTYGEPSDPGEQERTFASNFAPSLLQFIYERDVLKAPNASPEQMPFGTGQVLINSFRNGFIAIGGVYASRDTSAVERMDTLIHEARHSDCPELPSMQDMTFFQADQAERMSARGLRCTQIHVRCPAGHPLENEEACDAHFWGSYSAGYLFSKGIARWCTNCSEELRQEAIASAVSNVGRLMPRIRRAMATNSFPKPELNSLP